MAWQHKFNQFVSIISGRKAIFFQNAWKLLQSVNSLQYKRGFHDGHTFSMRLASVVWESKFITMLPFSLFLALLRRLRSFDFAVSLVRPMLADVTFLKLRQLYWWRASSTQIFILNSLLTFVESLIACWITFAPRSCQVWFINTHVQKVALSEKIKFDQSWSICSGCLLHVFLELEITF